MAQEDAWCSLSALLWHFDETGLKQGVSCASICLCHHLNQNRIDTCHASSSRFTPIGPNGFARKFECCRLWCIALQAYTFCCLACLFCLVQQKMLKRAKRTGDAISTSMWIVVCRASWRSLGVLTLRGSEMIWGVRGRLVVLAPEASC